MARHRARSASDSPAASGTSAASAAPAAVPPRAASTAPAALTALAALAVLAVAGCAGGGTAPAGGDAASAGIGSPPASPGPSSGSGTAAQEGEGSAAPGPSGAPGATRWCTTASLNASLRSLEPAAGNRYAALVLTNTSGASCRTQGWPGLQFTRTDGKAIPTHTVRDHGRPAQQFTLRAGGRAWSRLHWTVVPGEGDPPSGKCPAPAKLRVIPPDQRAALTVPWRLETVCGAGRIEARPFSPGTGPSY